MTSATIGLRDMRPDEYDQYTARQLAEYVTSLETTLPAGAALEKARQDLARLLPAGLATERHRLLVAEDDTGQVVGYAWLGLDDPRTGDPELSWLYDIRVEEAYRRRGYARAILAAVETLARRAGARRLGLNVFGYNTAAIALYESMKYGVTAQQMAKDL